MLLKKYKPRIGERVRGMPTNRAGRRVSVAAFMRTRTQAQEVVQAGRRKAADPHAQCRRSTGRYRHR